MREVPLVMPKMSMTMTEGTFLVWRRGEGDTVAAGDVVCEVASDKVDMEVECPVEGTLSRLVANPDQIIAVGDPLAFIATEADDMLEGLFDDAHPAVEQVATPPSRRGPRPAVPYARRRASELRVDIDTVTGSGTNGLITVADVEAAAPPTPSNGKAHVPSVAAPSAAPPSLPPEPAGPHPSPDNPFAAFGETAVEPLTRIGRISGPALAASWTSIPHVTHHEKADITELDAYRRGLDNAARDDGHRVTMLAFVLKAAVSALKAFPKVNSSLTPTGDELILKKYYHLGIAVDTEQGLVVPAIRDVDRKGIIDLSRELSELSVRARDGRLSADDVQGASFTVSSLGGIGGTAFTPIVNSPEAAILGVSRARIEPSWNGEDFVPALQLPLSLSYDHRIVDGALAARFTAHLAHLLEDVRRLIL